MRRVFLFRFPSSFREQEIILALIFLFVGFSIAAPHFLRIANLLNVLRQVSLLGIIAVGMTMVIISGEIDLSVGGGIWHCGGILWSFHAIRLLLLVCHDYGRAHRSDDWPF